MLVLVLVFVGTFAVVVAGVAYTGRERFAAARAARARLLPHVPRAGQDDLPGLVRRVSRLSGFRVVERFLLEAPLGRALAARASRLLREAAVQRTAGELLLASVLGGTLGVLVGVLAGSAAGALAAAWLGALAPSMVLRRIGARRRATLDVQLPQALETIASSLRAGYSLPAAVEFAASETQAPLGTELARLRDEQRLGIDVREAFAGFAERIATDDARLFVTAVLIQRETGGNLAELLANLAALVRDRHAFALRVAALTAEPRMSALVLALLPVGVFAVLLALNADYVRPLIALPAGRTLLLAAGALSAVGYLVMRRLGSVEL